MKMKTYNVTGMSCSACSQRVERAVRTLSGVDSCAVSLLTGTMGVEGSAPPERVIAAVRAAGYGASLAGASEQLSEDKGRERSERVRLLSRLFSSLFILLFLMYFSMGYTMYSFPIPPSLEKSPALLGIVQLVLSLFVMVINKRFFISGIRGLLFGSPNMDTLVALGSSASFGYSTYLVVLMIRAELSGGVLHEALHGLYFESAAMILVLITVGKILEARAKGKTADALRALMSLAPKTATVIRDGEEMEISADDVKIDDVFVVRAGNSVPVDGVVISGAASLDESSLTGESVPVDKGEGDRVFSATQSRSGYMKCRATGVGEDTTLFGIIRTVREAQATKAPIAKTADKVAGVFVPSVMIIALITFVVWMILGKGLSQAVISAISVLVISCPCALGLATPVAIMVGSGIGARGGILFKTAAALEEAGRCSVAVLDKTGTVTRGEMRVTDVIPAGGTDECELLSLAYSLEEKSEHPIGRAVADAGREMGVEKKETENFQTVPGNGLSANIGKSRVAGGNLQYISTLAAVGEKERARAAELSEAGKTPLFFASDGELIGIIGVADTIKDDSAEAVRYLRAMGLRVVMLTGDNERTARSIAAAAGIGEVVADVRPEGKAEAVKKLKACGKVIMVGDGINDAPALTCADVGMAIGAGTDVAVDSADVVLMNSSLLDCAAAVRLGRRTLRNIKENLFFAFIYNIIGIPLAAGVLSPLGLSLTPMFGALAMSLSSFCLVSNALRLNLLDIKSPKGDKRINKIKHKKEKKKMEVTMKIEGMMCPHCEARVKKCLEALRGVESAEASHEKGTVVVKLSKNVSEAKLKSAIEAQGYTVL